MLVLTRKLNERIIIGRDVEIVVLKVSGNRVRLGISAPTNVPVMRDDVLDRRGDEASRAINAAFEVGPAEVASCAGV